MHGKSNRDVTKYIGVELRRVKNLAHTATEEFHTVKKELVTVRAEPSDVKKQMADELMQVHERLDTISNSPVLTMPAITTSPNPSYIDVA